MILVGTKDFGPARYLYELTNNHPKEFCWIYSPSLSLFFKEKKIKTLHKWKDLKNIKLVLTGTCLQGGIDKNLLIWAKKNKIPSVSCIDHWTLFKERFKLSNKIIYPDYIILNDKYAFKLAIEEGLPKKKLFVGGNPIIEKLFSKKMTEFAKHTKNKNMRRILFISESLHYFKKEKHTYKGYSEYQVLRKLINTLTKQDVLTIKKHPSERKEKYSSFKKKYNLKETIVSDLNRLIKNFDFFVGMESMLLIQLSFITSNVISFRPGAKKIGLVNKAETKEDLEDLLKYKLIKQKINISKIRRHYLKSEKQIFNFIKKVSL